MMPNHTRHPASPPSRRAAASATELAMVAVDALRHGGWVIASVAHTEAGRAIVARRAGDTLHVDIAAGWPDGLAALTPDAAADLADLQGRARRLADTITRRGAADPDARQLAGIVGDLFGAPVPDPADGNDRRVPVPVPLPGAQLTGKVCPGCGQLRVWARFAGPVMDCTCASCGMAVDPAGVPREVAVWDSVTGIQLRARRAMAEGVAPERVAVLWGLPLDEMLGLADGPPKAWLP